MTNLAERFYAKVAFDHPTRCWEWTATRNEDGYGRIYVGPKVHGAHRVAWSLWYGKPVPLGMSVMHRCDNPPCVNPYHLEIGTHGDNIRDMFKRGRASLRNGLRIDDETAREIQRRSLAGETQAVLSAEYGISSSQVSNIKLGKRPGL